MKHSGKPRVEVDAGWGDDRTGLHGNNRPDHEQSSLVPSNLEFEFVDENQEEPEHDE